jgi:hypothetical protein
VPGVAPKKKQKRKNDAETTGMLDLCVSAVNLYYLVLVKLSLLNLFRSDRLADSGASVALLYASCAVSCATASPFDNTYIKESDLSLVMVRKPGRPVQKRQKWRRRESRVRL